MYTIYCHIFPNGKRYVGLTRSSLHRRFGPMGANYKCCPLISRAIQKYGWENVEHVVLDTAETQEEAEEKERYYVKLYDTRNPEKGYNVLPGGDVSNNCATPEMRYKLGKGWRGKHRSEEEKAKIGEGVRKRFERPESNGHHGLKASPEVRMKMSESHKKRWDTDTELRVRQSEMMKKRMQDPAYKEKILQKLSESQREPGTWHMSDQAKEKLSKHFKGKWLGENSPCSKPVLQFDKNGNFIKRWSNAGEAERAGIALRSNISKCCLHKPHIHTVGGFKWEFDQ